MKKFVGLSALIAVSALVLAGCAAATPTATSTANAAGVDAKAAALLPDVYKGGVNVASDIPYAPMEMFDKNNQPIGFDVDLANALGAKLGVKFTVEKQAFDTIIASVKAGKHDIIMSSMSDTTDRQKTLDFVDYFNGGASLLVSKGNAAGITGMADLCGKPVAAEAATWEIDLLNSQTDTCKKAGKPAVEILALPGDTDAQSAVRSGKAVAYLADSQLAAYAVKIAGNGSYFDLVIDPAAPNGYESGLIGVGVLKGNDKLTAAIQAALQSLMDDGGYQALLTKWNLNSFSVPSATLNGTK